MIDGDESGQVLGALLLVAIAGCERPGLLVPQAGLHLADCAPDGSGLAWLDLSGALLWASPEQALAPTIVAAHADDGAFANGIAMALSGVDATTGVAANVVVRDHDGAVRPLPAGVRTSSLKAAHDSTQLYFETVADATAGTEDLFLDDAPPIVSGAHKEKARWAPVGHTLVLGANIPDAAGRFRKVVRSYDDDGIHEIVADNAANETAISHDGARVLYGANENGSLVGLEMQPIAGGQRQLLASGALDTRFLFTEDDARVVFMSAAGIEVVGIDGSGRRTVHALALGPVLDLVATAGDIVVYVTAVDASGLLTLGAVSLERPIDIALGAAATDEGFTSDGTAYLFRDAVSPQFGRLRAFIVASGSVVTLAEIARKAQPAGTDVVAFVDVTNHLFVMHAAAAAHPTQVQYNVDTFHVLGGSTATPKLAYSIRAGENAGIWLVDPAP